MFDFINVCRALSDENRVRILLALRYRPLCVCQVTAFLDLAPSTTSKHLSILRQARLIEGRKNGRWVYYKLAESSRTPALVREALAFALAQLCNDPLAIEDQARMAAIVEKELACGLDAVTAENCHSPELHAGDPRFMDDDDSAEDSDSDNKSVNNKEKHHD